MDASLEIICAEVFIDIDDDVYWLIHLLANKYFCILVLFSFLFI